MSSLRQASEVQLNRLMQSSPRSWTVLNRIATPDLKMYLKKFSMKGALSGDILPFAVEQKCQIRALLLAACRWLWGSNGGKLWVKDTAIYSYHVRCSAAEPHPPTLVDFRLLSATAVAHQLHVDLNCHHLLTTIISLCGHRAFIVGGL